MSETKRRMVTCVHCGRLYDLDGMGATGSHCRACIGGLTQIGKLPFVIPSRADGCPAGDEWTGARMIDCVAVRGALTDEMAKEARRAARRGWWARHGLLVALLAGFVACLIWWNQWLVRHDAMLERVWLAKEPVVVRINQPPAEPKSLLPRIPPKRRAPMEVLGK